MASLSKKLYLLKRMGNSFFTYNCASCKKAVRGKCLCDECERRLVPAENSGGDMAFGYYYESTARDAVLRYKFSGDYEFCLDTICGWLSEGFAKLPEEKIDFVIPVPSYKRKTTRLSELVKKFAVMEGLVFKPEYLRKIRATKKQHELSYDERLTNLAGAFEAEDAVAGKTILLVDDIYTTGATVSECKKALFAKGAGKVIVLTALKAGRY